MGFASWFGWTSEAKLIKVDIGGEARRKLERYAPAVHSRVVNHNRRNANA